MIHTPGAVIIFDPLDLGERALAAQRRRILGERI